jgi:hypothetical protein
MAHSSYQILRASDRRIIEGFAAIWKALDGPDGAQYSFQILEGNVQPLAGPAAKLKSDPTLEQLVELGSTVVRSASLVLPTPQGQASVQINRQPTGYDEVRYHLPDGISVEAAMRGTGAVRKAFFGLEPTGALDQTLGPELAEFYRRREEALLRLEQMSQEQLRQGVDHRRELDQRLDEERRQLAVETEAARARLEAEYGRKDQDLAGREERLAADLKTLDDRSNTHARRQLRSELKLALAARNTKFTKLSEATARKRWPIHGLFIALTVLAATGVWASFTATLGATGWVPLARLGLSTLTLVGVVGFYIRWNDRWGQKHADEEFKLRRLELDVDRASWVVETALEWKEERGSQIPPELLERLARNLFREGEAEEPVRHPAEDAISAILAAATGVRLNVPGVGEVTLDRRGLRRLEKAQADGATRAD